MESINNNNDFSIRETTMDTSKHESLNRYKYFMKGFGMVFVVALSCLYVMEHVLSPILQLNAKDHDHLQKSSMNENDAHLTHLMNPLYSRVMNVDESPSSSKNDVAFFFHVPMSAGTIMKDIFSTCYLHLLKGEIDHYPPNKDLIILNTRRNHPTILTENDIELQQQQQNQLLGEMIEGNSQNRRMKSSIVLGEENEPDVIYSSTLLEEPLRLGIMSSLRSKRKLRLFTLLRHPIQQSYSLFQYVITATWEPSYFPDLSGMTLKEVLQHPSILGDNFVTRTLTNTPLDHPLTEQKYHMAEEILRTKFLIGFVEELPESWFRIQNAFQWENIAGAQECADNILWRNHVQHQQQQQQYRHEFVLSPQSEEWSLLERINEYDLRLYNAARTIFEEQTHLFYTPEEIIFPSPWDVASSKGMTWLQYWTS